MRGWREQKWCRIAALLFVFASCNRTWVHGVPVGEDTEGECTQPSATRVDASPHCARWAAEGQCEQNPDYMGRACASSCAGKISLPDMTDSNRNCAKWAADGECTSNPNYMAVACAASCAGKLGMAAGSATASAGIKTPVQKPFVPWPDPVLPADLARAQQEADAEEGARRTITGCVDVRQDCSQLARGNLSGCGEADMMLTNCRQTCGTCAQQAVIKELQECVDKHNNCKAWAAAGECGNNKAFMFSSCSMSCGVCQQKKSGCVRRNTTPGVTAPSGMAAMFESALTNFPQYSPQALSTDPWVVQFENLVSAEEAARIVALPGEKLIRSKAGDHVSPVRTSTQYWCEDADGCAGDAAVRAVTQRMCDITRMPPEHAEFMQILRYEPGQFYKTHHDQQSAHWTPQGVRVYTFFVYLSEVEAGGGTKFNDLNITITPKIGRAVLWPNVRGEDLRRGEPNTHHEALAVEQGIKYGANLWIHLYDYRTPSRAGTCPFVGMNTHYEDIRSTSRSSRRIALS